MDLSVIIPTLNEEKNIVRLIHTLCHHDPNFHSKIFVVDGGSSDRTIELCKSLGVNTVLSSIKNRAAQMNLGARKTNSDILYFIHADTLPPRDFRTKILSSIENGHSSGCFPFKFDSGKALLKINNWFSTLPYLWCRGGDQSLYITRTCWEEVGPYPELEIMEEYHLLRRISRSQFPFDIMDGEILVSDRKYRENPYLKVQWVNFMAYRMFIQSVNSNKIRDYYEKSLCKGRKYGE